MNSDQVKQKLFTIVSAWMMVAQIMLSGFFLHPAYAATPNQVEQGVVQCGKADLASGATSIPDACTLKDLFYLVVRITNMLISLAGVFAVFFIIKSSLQMVIAQGDTGALAKAKKGLTNAVLGFIIVMIAFLTVNTVFEGSLKLGLSTSFNILKDPVGYISGGSNGP